MYAIIVFGLVGNFFLFKAFYKSVSESEANSNLKLAAWNVQSGDNDPDVIADQIKYFADYDLIGLNEVNSKNVDAYAKALGPQFQTFMSKTGGANRLAILFDKNRFELLEQKEMFEYRDWTLNNGTHRSPIYVRLKERQTGYEFIFMTNHLARKNGKLRQERAAGLREWARDSNTPIVAIGAVSYTHLTLPTKA